MKNRDSSLSTSRHTIVVGFFAVVVALQPVTLRAQPGIKPSAVKTGVPPSRVSTKLKVPLGSPSDETPSLPPQAAVTSRKIPCGHWIIKARSVFPETTQNQLAECEYWWCPGGRDGQRYPYNLNSFVTEIASNSAPICVVVHGAMYGFQHVVREAPGFSNALRELECVPTGVAGEGLNVVFFSWPSAARCPIPSLTGTQSSHHGRHTLAPLLEQLPPGRRICLIGHSYGARVILSTLHQVALNEAKDFYLRGQQPVNPARYRVILLAAAVDHDWLNPDQRYALALPRAERLLNVYNPNDFALLLYSIRHPWAHEALGRNHFHDGDYRYLAADTDKIEPPLNASPLIGIRHSAANYRIPPEMDSIGYRDAVRRSVFFDDNRIGVTVPEMTAPSSGKSPPNLSMSPGAPKSPHPKSPRTQVRTHAAF